MTRFRVDAPDVIHQTIDGEVILVHLARGTYHSLRGSGTALFEALTRGVPSTELASLFEGPADAAALESFVADLVREGLIVPTDEQPPVAPVERRAYTPPVVETFTDLTDLLNADPVHEVAPAGWPHVTREKP